jgi:hypothetical protein
VTKGLYGGLASFILISFVLLGQSATDEVRNQPNPGKRSEVAIEAANRSLDEARESYLGGDSKKGDSEIKEVEALADECLSSVEQANKYRYWKKAELKIRQLTRRVESLTDDLGYDQRAKAQELRAHLDQIHDKLLAGVMRK